MLAQHISNFVPAARVSVALLVGEGMCEVFALAGESTTLPLGARIPTACTGIEAALNERRVVDVRDAAKSAYKDHQMLAGRGLVSIINAPLRASGENIGTLNVAHPQRGIYCAEDIEFFEHVAVHLAFRLECLSALEQSRAALAGSELLRRRLEALNTLAQRMSAVRSEVDAFRIVGELLPSIVPTDRASWVVFADDRDFFEIRGVIGHTAGLDAAARIPSAHTSMFLALTEQRTIVVEDLREAVSPEGALLAKAGLISGITAPVVVGGQCLGALNVAAAQIGAYGPSEVELVAHVSAFLGWAVKSTRLVAGLREAAHELERRVVERTAALEATNEKLEEEIADRVLAQASLAVARDAAESASRAKSRFLATMSHEIRTPMNGVLGMTRLLQQGALDEPQKKQVDRIAQSGEALLVIINDILDFSKIEAGKLELEVHPFDPQQAVDQVIGLCRERARRKRLGLRVEIDPDVRSPVSGDAGRVRQVLSNLVDNAIKFTESGTVTVRLMARPPRRVALDDEDRAWLRFVVSDTGIGMAEAARARVFEPFAQADNTTTRRFGGTGLGLAIVRELVLAMGGVIDLTSTPGAGSVFVVDLPFAASLGEPRVPAGRPTETAAPSMDGVRVLLCEDNEINEEVAIATLTALGVEVDVARNGVEAIAYAGRTAYDLILMDCQMPEVDGFDATRAIRVRERTDRARVPIIALTANALKGDRELCLSAGMDDYLSKPFGLAQLRGVIERWVPARLVPTTPPEDAAVVAEHVSRHAGD